MASLAKLIPFVTAIIFFFGQLLRINFQSNNFPLIDIFIIILALINVIFQTKNSNFQIQNKPLLFFGIWAIASLLLNFIIFRFSLTPLLYLLRILSLFTFFIIGPNQTLFTKKFISFFIVLIITNIIFGLLQYFLWPDFTYFKSLGWDPHLYRLVGTFFDPTFTALIYLFFLILIFNSTITPKSLKFALIIITYLALALTYSRSAYISLFIVSVFIGYRLKNLKLPIITIIALILTILILPRMPGEGTKLERSSSILAKIENYKQGYQLFTKSPIIGTGYNRLPQTRKDLLPNSHAIGGFDGSLLTILVTTGIPGLILFLFSLLFLFNSSSLLFQSLLIALLIHSLFANSLLYPWVLLFLVFVRNFKSRI